MDQLENALAIKDLSPEIALLRVKLNSLLNDPTASPDRTFKTLDSLAKLIIIQKRCLWLT